MCVEIYTKGLLSHVGLCTIDPAPSTHERNLPLQMETHCGDVVGFFILLTGG